MGVHAVLDWLVHYTNMPPSHLPSYLAVRQEVLYRVTNGPINNLEAQGGCRQGVVVFEFHISTSAALAAALALLAASLLILFAICTTVSSSESLESVKYPSPTVHERHRDLKVLRVPLSRQTLEFDPLSEKFPGRALRAWKASQRVEVRGQVKQVLCKSPDAQTR